MAPNLLPPQCKAEEKAVFLGLFRKQVGWAKQSSGEILSQGAGAVTEGSSFLGTSKYHSLKTTYFSTVHIFHCF